MAHTVSLVDAKTGREIDRIERLAPRGTHAAYPNVALAPDDRILAVMSRPNVVQFFELTAAGKVRRPLATITDERFYPLVFSPVNDQVLLVGSRGASLYNVRTAKRIAKWNDAMSVSDAVFAKEGRVVVELVGGMVRVRDALSGKELRSFPLDAHPRCESVALSPDETVLAAGGYEERVRLYDFQTGREIRFMSEKETHGPVESVAISDDGDWIASAESKGLVSLWDKNDGWKRTALRDDDIKAKFVYDTSAGPNFLTFLPGKDKLLAGSGIHHNSLNVWDAESAEREQRFVGHAMPIIGVAASRNGRVIASTSRDATLRVWDETGKQLQTMSAGGNSLSLSPDGSRVAVSLARNGPIRGHNGVPEPQLPVSTVEVWNTATGTLVQSFTLGSDERRIPQHFYSVSFSHDGRFLAGVADDGLHVWDLAAGKQKRLIPLSQPPANVNNWNVPRCGGAFSPVDNIIAVPTTEGSILIFDVEADANTPLAKVKGHDGPVHSISWRRDGRFVVSGGNDSTIILWRVKR